MKTHTESHFVRKAYGRIFVWHTEDVEKVKNIIKEMDEFEFDYLPDDLITCDIPFIVHSDGEDYYEVELAYTHKFCDLDLNELQYRCFLAGVPAYIWVGGMSESEKVVYVPVKCEK